MISPNEEFSIPYEFVCVKYDEYYAVPVLSMIWLVWPHINMGQYRSTIHDEVLFGTVPSVFTYLITHSGTERSVSRRFGNR